MADVAHSTTNITGGHANAVAGGAAGFLSGTDKTKLDGIEAAADVTANHLGASGSTACAGNDSRLADSRTPTAHAVSHKSGGSDEIKLNELGAASAAVAFNSQEATSLGAPTTAASAARRADVDAAVITVAATYTAALPASTYANGTAGVGATLTANANGALPAADGYAPQVGDKIFYQNGTVENGVWVIGSLGSGGSTWNMTRYTGCDTAAKIAGSRIRVQFGVQSGGAEYVNKAVAALTIGTSSPFWKRTDSRMGPNEGTRWFDTFVDPNTPANATVQGPSGWRFVISGAGTAVVTTAANTATVIGAFTISSGTVATGFGGFESSYIAGNADGGWTIVPGVNVDYEFECRIQAPVLSTSAQEFAINAGFSKQRATSQKVPADGILFVYDRTNATSALNWLAVCSVGGVATVVDTGVAVNAAQYYRLKFVHDAGDNAVRFYVDGALVATITTNIPTAVVLGGLVDGLKNVGTTTTSVLGCDWIGLDVHYPQRLAA